MNCKRARAEIALWAGEDLDQRSSGQLERHVAVCPACRAYRHQMVESLNALRQPESSPAQDAGERRESVWPTVSGRLATAKEQARAERLNRWLPAAAVIAACLAVIAFTHEPEPPRQNLSGQPILTEPFPVRSAADEEAAIWVVDPRSRGGIPENASRTVRPDSADAIWDEVYRNVFDSTRPEFPSRAMNDRTRRVNLQQE